jgi:hypothetical protein
VKKAALLPARAAAKMRLPSKRMAAMIMDRSISFSPCALHPSSSNLGSLDFKARFFERTN